MYYFGLFALLHKKRAKVLKKMQICKEMDKKFTLKCYFACKDIRENAFYHFSRRFGVFVGHTRDIRGVFMGYTYVSGMCRVCIGYVSGKCRNIQGARGGASTN